ncbi:MAG: hypothetical protein ACRC7O_04020, partial [Fimbriiglobus sp.]
AAGTVYLGYLTAMIAVWTGLFICVLAGLYLPIFVLDHRLNAIPREPDRRMAELTVVVVYVMTLLTVASVVPTAAVLGGCAILTLGCVLAFARPGNSEPAMLWRAGPKLPISAIPMHRLVAGVTVGFALLVFDLLLTACGGRLFGERNLPDSMPLTSILGVSAAWLIPGAVGFAAVKALAGLRADPARRTPPTLHVRGADPVSVSKAAELAGAWGWLTRTTPDAVRTDDVAVEIVLQEQSRADEFEPGWPLRVSVEDLADGRVKSRLARRDEIQLRRRVFRGIRTVFKLAFGERGRRGGGYWFAAHWWFVDAIGREEPARGTADDSQRPVGPGFADAFGPRPRQHLHAVFRAVAVDMVYIEDGVNLKAIERVLRALFELYDVHGGKRIAEDHHFRGVPKVCVMIHEYAPGTKFRTAPGYKEPGFDDLSRARVLHVFKDRGGEKAEIEFPYDSSWEPAPALGV